MATVWRWHAVLPVKKIMVAALTGQLKRTTFVCFRSFFAWKYLYVVLHRICTQCKLRLTDIQEAAARGLRRLHWARRRRRCTACHRRFNAAKPKLTSNRYCGASLALSRRYCGATATDAWGLCSLGSLSQVSSCCWNRSDFILICSC